MMTPNEAIAYLMPIAESADPAMRYGEALHVLIGAVDVDMSEMRARDEEIAKLRRDLDAGFAESDHLSAKYYQRMRAAEKEMRSRELHHFEVEQAIASVIAARSNHPECDRHDEGDPVACGWKRAVQDIDAALATYQNGADQ